MNRVVGDVDPGRGSDAHHGDASTTGTGTRCPRRTAAASSARTSYDALNRLDEARIAAGIQGEGPLGHDRDGSGTTRSGNKRWETDVAGLRTDYEYDALYRVKTKLLPER